MFHEKFCDICHCLSDHYHENDVQVKREFLTGAEGCFSLNEHLKMYFITTKLLKLPESEFFKVVMNGTKEKRSKPSDDGDMCSGDLVYINMCTHCEIIVNEALNFHMKIMALRKKVDQLGKVLSERMVITDGSIFAVKKKKYTKIGNSQQLKRKTPYLESSQKIEDETARKMLNAVACFSGKEVFETEEDKNEFLEKAHSDLDYVPEKDTSASNSEGEDENVQSDNNLQQNTRKLQPFSDEPGEEQVKDDLKTCAGELPTAPAIAEQEVASRVLDSSTNVLIDSHCTTCGKMFSSRHQLNIHALRMHGIESHYTCQLCPDLKFSRKRFLVEHRSKVHKTVCDKCGKQLSCKTSLVSHLKLVHKIFLNYPCHLCKMQFKTSSQRKAHHAKMHAVSKGILVKLPLRPPQTLEEEKWAKIPCNICGRKYLSGEALDKHILCRHERKLSNERKEELKINCCFCWKSFHLEQRLAVHTMVFHPDVANKFPCERCNDQNSVFQSCTQLRKHFEENHVGVAIHNCTKCTWPFLRKDLLTTHKQVHKWVKPVTDDIKKGSRDVHPFKCWFCWDTFPDDTKFQKHLNHPRLHGNKGFKVEFYCDVDSCEHHIKTPFVTVEDLNQHLATAHVHPNLIQKCTVCSWGFVSPYMLELHKLNHVHSNKGKRPCPNCDRFSRSLKGLRKHYNIHHGKNLKLFKCLDCGADFISKIQLQQHNVVSHKVAKDKLETFSKIPCDQCGKLYQNEISLKAHYLNSHGHYECKDCGEMLESGFRLAKHQKAVHNSGQKYLCSVCGKELLSKFQLRTHMNIHKKKRYMCHLCHIRMTDLDKMKEHIKRKHKNPSENKEFVCGECGKGFKRKDTLDDHVRINHSEETWRVWSCDKCGRRFKRSGLLKRHQKGEGCDGPLEIVTV